MDHTLSPAVAARLERLRPLSLDPHAAIAIKRDVHEFVVATDARSLADAFAAVVTAPTSRFGLIRVKRPAARLGQPFRVGERFQGCFSLEAAGRALGARQELFGLGFVASLVSLLEDQMLSNYAVVESIESPAGDGVHRLRYRYLEGTPIAGSSSFEIEDLPDGRCLFRQIFEYQEVGGLALHTFQSFGLKMHDQVVCEQVRQAAARIGAEVLSGTIPVPYAELLAAGSSV